MATTEAGHHPNFSYVDQDGNIHLNGASIYANESGVAISGTDLAAIDGVIATPAEINRAADVSARLIAAGSSLTLTELAHDGKVVCLDTAAGSTITLPAATGSGMVLTFVVTVKPTSNQHRLNVVGNDEFCGSVNILDMDGSTQAAFGAVDGGDNDRFDLNGTTKGGQVGDWVQLVDMSTDNWCIRGQLVCPTGSNPATPFATGQVS